MPLLRGEIKPGVRLKSRYITDLYDLLSGVITDTDVTIGRNLTVHGALSTVGSVSQVAPGPGNVPFTIYGAPGQTADLFDVRDSNSNLLFSINAGGTVMTPRIGDYTLAQHNHSSPAQGGVLTPVTMESLYAGATVVITGASYTVAAGVMYVFCTTTCTVTLPAAASTNRPISITTGSGTVSVASAGGSVNGGSVNSSTGAIMNGTIIAGDSITYKSDLSNWRAV
jgi:hypothetical protein